MKLKISLPDLELEAGLKDSQTARKVYSALPIESRVNRWGEEIYFKVPVKAELEIGAKQVVEVGDIGYWVEGKCIAIFFGPTPISEKGEPRAVSYVNVFGKILGNPKALKKVKDGEKIVLTKY